MKLNTLKNNSSKGFTLIEMIGVLAVIAILAALLIPKVFQAITEARINTVPVGCATAKTGTVDNYAKNGGLANVSPTSAWADVPTTAGSTGADYDDEVLLAGGFIDKPFAPRVGTTADVLLGNVTGYTGATAVGAAAGLTYDLDGDTDNDVIGTHVVFAQITGVPIADAQAISARIDGITMSQTEGTTTQDIEGRVKYAADATGLTTVFIYLTHR